MNVKKVVSALFVGSFALAYSTASFTQDGAAQQQQQQKQQQKQAQQKQQQKTVTLGSNYQSKDIIGQDVKNKQGEELGEISNLVIDPSGRVTYAILSTGGLGGKDYAVPWNRVQVSPDMEQVTLDVQKNRLASEFSAFEEKQEKQEKKEQQKTGESETPKSEQR